MPFTQLLSARALPAAPGVWDELRADDGALRPSWHDFAAALPAHATADALARVLDRRVAQVAQRIRLDGVTHNVFGGGAAPASRPWSLELLPLIIDAADWAAIEAGVVQRAALLERVLVDVYGAQRLLREGLLPPALLLRHSGWLRQMIGVEPPLGMRLFLVAFDLARGPDGRWWQVAQRTQVPSGLGYVLHNRLVVSRQFPEAFRDLRVQHIASSYRRLLDTLETAARSVARGDNPRIVLLTPGPYSETYFEHAFLARYLGLPLAEGGDLTVRDERLYLKTVEGLVPVHGVLRRLDDDWCDPLELRGDSALGVPGLLQAVRAGSVAMANALGSAFLESPAIQGFLPAIARRLTGKELLLPSLPTWWCGEAAAWADVRTQLDGKLVRSTFPAGGRTSQLRRADAEPLCDDPDAWTVQGRLRFARAPVWGAGAVHPRPAMVRVYAVADGGGRWHVLPGGMTRVVAARGRQRRHAARRQQPRHLGAAPKARSTVFRCCRSGYQVDDIVQRRQPVGSRMGENLFWLGRYTERTEQLVRLARVTLSMCRWRQRRAKLRAAGTVGAGRARRAGARRRADAGAVGAPLRARGAGWLERCDARDEHRVQPGGARARVAGAARAAVVRTLEPAAHDAQTFSLALEAPRRASCRRWPRCSRRWTGWRCSSPRPPARKPTACRATTAGGCWRWGGCSSGCSA